MEALGVLDLTGRLFRAHADLDYVLTVRKFRSTWTWTLHNRQGGSSASTMAGVSRKHVIASVLNRPLRLRDGSFGRPVVRVFDVTRQRIELAPDSGRVLAREEAR